MKLLGYINIILACILSLCLIHSCTAHAEIGLESGYVTYMDLPELNHTYRDKPINAIYTRTYSEDFYTEFRVGVEAVSTSIGVRSDGNFFIESSLGVAHVYNRPWHMKHSEQFIATFGVGMKLEELDLILRLRHYSNGSKFGIGSEPNYGLDTIVLGIEW